MFKILIVDDEPLIRMGILTSIEWTKYDIQALGASNGAEALEITSVYKPQVIITDVRMPIMNGLALSQQINKLYPYIIVIILSGYDDFTYAQEAITHHVYKYILKPFGAEDLLEIVLELKAEHELKKINCAPLKKNHSFDLAATQKFIAHLDNLTDDSLFDSSLLGYDSSDIPFKNPTVIIVRIDGFYRISPKKSHADLTEEKQLILNAVHSYISDYNFFILNSEGPYFLIIADSSSAETLHAIENLNPSTGKGKVYTFTFFYGNHASSFHQLHKSYQEASYLALRSLHFNYNTTNPINATLTDRTENITTINQIKSLYTELKHAAQNERKNMVLSALAPMHEMMYKNETIHHSLLKILFQFLDFSSDQEHTSATFSLTESLEAMKMNDIWDDLTNWFYMRIEDILEQDYPTLQHNSFIVKTSKHYATNHYHKHISLKEIASVVYVSPNYFCKIFKKETGENFVDWLNTLRIQKSQELLRTKPYLKTYEIAERVGFSNYKYFSTLFKKNIGISPKEYRNTKKE